MAKVKKNDYALGIRIDRNLKDKVEKILIDQGKTLADLVRETFENVANQYEAKEK